MIKVGIFIDTYYPMVNGVISVVDNCAKRLQGEDFEVTVFCPIHDKKYVDDFNYKVERCKSFKVFFLDYRAPIPRLDRAFLKALRESNLDIVHIHSAFALGSMATRYAKKHNIPAIATLHSQYKKDFYKTTHSKVITSILLKNAIKVFNRCDECFTVNNAVADIFDEYGIKEHPAVIKNSTNFTPVEDRETAVKKVNEIFNLPKDVPVFTFLGRIYALKNVYFLVDAMSKLKDKNYRLLMVGDGKDLPALKKVVDAGVKVVASAHYFDISHIKIPFMEIFELFVILDHQEIGKIKGVYSQKGEMVL